MKTLIAIASIAILISNALPAHAETKSDCYDRVANEFDLCMDGAQGQLAEDQCFADWEQSDNACDALPIVTSGTLPSTTPQTTTPPTVTTPASSTGTTAPVTLTNPLGTTDIRLLIARLIKAVLSIIGVIALLMFVYGGLLWMISAGNEKQVEKGKEVLKWTTLGILLIVSAYVIVNALFRAAFTGGL